MEIGKRGRVILRPEDVAGWRRGLVARRMAIVTRVPCARCKGLFFVLVCDGLTISRRRWKT